MSTSPLLEYVGTTTEAAAAFAADGYARVAGLGVVAVTYGPGALSAINAIAGTDAESSPVVLISGAPKVAVRCADEPVHHRFGPFDFQRQIFKRLSVAAEVLDNPLTAACQADRAIALAIEKRKHLFTSSCHVAWSTRQCQCWQHPRRRSTNGSRHAARGCS
jgi:alpha-keto-acid decarboxylase